jgi:hypothetical protein
MLVQQTGLFCMRQLSSAERLQGAPIGGYARPEPQQGMTTERYSVRSAQVAPTAEYESLLSSTFACLAALRTAVSAPVA